MTCLEAVHDLTNELLILKLWAANLQLWNWREFARSSNPKTAVDQQQEYSDCRNCLIKPESLWKKRTTAEVSSGGLPGWKSSPPCCRPEDTFRNLVSPPAWKLAKISFKVYFGDSSSHEAAWQLHVTCNHKYISTENPALSLTSAPNGTSGRLGPCKTFTASPTFSQTPTALHLSLSSLVTRHTQFCFITKGGQVSERFCFSFCFLVDFVIKHTPNCQNMKQSQETPQWINARLLATLFLRNALQICWIFKKWVNEQFC